MFLREAWKAYISDKKLLGYSQNTLRQYAIQLRLIEKYFGSDARIDDITALDLKRYLAVTTEHLKPASIGHRMRFLKSIFRWAVDEGVIPSNPAAKLREPKQGHRIPKSISAEDIESLRIACEHPADHVILELLYSTGCRIGEIQALNRNDVNYDERSIIVRGKGDKEREVYFDTRCAIWVRKYLKWRTDDDPALIVTERAPRRMSVAQIRYRLKRVADRSGIGANVYPHKLRHSYAMHLLDNGAPLELIQDLLGHAKLDTTRIYAQLSGERRRELYRKYR